MGRTVQQAVADLNSLLTQAEPPSVTQVTDIVRSVDWFVPQHKTVLLYSGAFA